MSWRGQHPNAEWQMIGRELGPMSLMVEWDVNLPFYYNLLYVSAYLELTCDQWFIFIGWVLESGK